MGPYGSSIGVAAIPGRFKYVLLLAGPHRRGTYSSKPWRDQTDACSAGRVVGNGQAE